MALWQKQNYKNIRFWEFSDSPVVRTLKVSLLRALVQSLVRELILHKPPGMAKINK